MKTRATPLFLFLLVLGFLLSPTPSPATDVDGPDDCVRPLEDFGDAPEGVQAYPGVIGSFPTCQMPGPIGTQQFLCGTPFGPAPGPAGFVRHIQAPGNSFWLGCLAFAPPQGIDSEIDGKVNDNGAPFSACNPQQSVDCLEAAFGLNFGQDDCYGGSDAGVGAPVVFQACSQATVAYNMYSCIQGVPTGYLNVLVDWNQDGDWNDAYPCPSGCAYEWAVRNFPLNVMPGCTSWATPQFLTGPFAGPGWMRISVSLQPMPPDYPWNGTVSLGGAVQGGETEDYPINIELAPQPCPGYYDMGDAPEETTAYPSGFIGHFPTCIQPGSPGTQEIAPGCQPISLPPAQTGYVAHRSRPTDPWGFWLGCAQPYSVDSDRDGKMNSDGSALSFCNQTVGVDCGEAAWGMTFGQDECIADNLDAGVNGLPLMQACQPYQLQFDAYNCKTVAQAVYLNILVDWNQDGDWNDVVLCTGGTCTPEWAIANLPLTLNPGCQSLVSPAFRVGPNAGPGWLRLTLTKDPVPPDFPWNGSLAMVNGEFEGGETEDYPVTIEPLPDPCPQYRDAGDAPEDVQAYPGVPGFFPTCQYPGLPGTQQLAPGCPPISTPPGLTGYVEHRRALGNPLAFWLGCWNPGVDSEFDGKMNDTGAPASACNPGQPTDCVEPAFGLNFAQDECYGDGVDAGIRAALQFIACRQATVTFDAMNCGAPRDVYLNVLVDWNRDGDWNDNFVCPQAGCAYEWAVKNVLIVLPSGCTTMSSPAFLVGPNPGEGWLRVTLSEQPAPDDFPWNGTLSVPTQVFEAGETEDYPVTILRGDPCEEPYIDYGDAPENIQAYPGVRGLFPTCLAAAPPANQIIQCGVPLSLPPGPTGFVRHVSNPQGLWNFWLGCPDPVSGFPGVDSELDGKTNDTGVPLSACSPNQPVDCVEPLWLPFGQDECTGDLDAGVQAMYRFPQCTMQQVQFLAYNCGPQTEALVNVLVDWGQDGDWNDNVLCPYTNFCAPEWALKNLPILLQPGCNVYVTPPFRVGPNRGPSWMRITLSRQAAPDDFPWNGTVGLPGQQFEGGETEDYPVEIVDSPIGVTDQPLNLVLAPAVPNPARGTTTLRFSVPVEQEVTLAAYDIHGRQVRALRSGTHSAGVYNVAWDFTSDGGSRLPAGVYLVKLTADDQVFTQRVIRVR